MFTHRSLQLKNILNLRSNYMLKRNLQGVAESKTLNYRETYFAPHLKKEPQREPFLKNLLFTRFDYEVLKFPVTQSSDRYKDFTKWLKAVEDYVSSCAGANEGLDKAEVLANLKDLEVFRAHFSEEYFGFDLSETESLKLIETLSALPWLGTYITKNYIVPVQIISKYGTDFQKKEYFPQIINGDTIPTVCIKEGDGGTNINNIESNVMPHEGDTLILNGEKSYVVNGTNSNLFIVFVRDLSANIFDKKSYSAVLVERDFGGITFSNVHETIGRHEIPMCTVNFKNTVIPRRNLIGQPGGGLDIMLEQLKPGRQNISGQAISILRNFTNRLITDVIKTKHFDRNLYEFESVKKILSDIVYSLYTMESMAYLTSGLADFYENQDVEFEKIITEKFCANKCLNCIQTGLQLMGMRSYLNGNAYIQAFHDALALTTLDNNNIDASVYVPSAAVQYVAKTTHDHVFKRRNPNSFPIFNMIQNFFTFSEPNLRISDNVHPSLHFSGQFLEESVPKLHKSIMLLLENYGTETVERQIELLRLTDMLTELYATTANLSRATRSYCIGLRNADTERNMVGIMGYSSKVKVLELYQEIEDGDLINGDYIHKSAVNVTYEKREYPMEHPLSRTF